MRYYLHYRRLLLWSVAVLGVMLIVAAAALANSFTRFQQASAYPGATLVSDHTIYGRLPRLSMRYDASYRTSARFPEVYNWYSDQFDLGPETYAQSACILMARSSKVFGLIERQTSVTLCDTPGDERLVFVMRSMMIRWR